VTCAELGGLDADDAPLVPLLAARGVDAAAVVWDDAAVDWDRFDLVVLRSTWDYAERRDEFLAWAALLPRVLNPLPVLEWNTDKQRYLSALAADGIPIVPTLFAEPGDPVELPPAPLVVKPAISAGGRSSGCFDAGEEDAARELVHRIHAEGRTAMLQPYLADGHGEIALAYSGGRYSHSLARSAPLPRGLTEAVLYLEETLGPREASDAERAVADAAVACAPGGDDLLYGRVDLLHDEHGEPLVLELELAEPSLYLSFGAGAAERFADSIAAAV
jgi:glutathione synthase/RimK-type ligase-like ATP-grasp enzyme